MTRAPRRFNRLLAAAALSLAAAPVWAQGFDLQGHRGARGLAPENTIAAFTRALEIGVTTLETDLAVSKDGVLVISHDPALNPALTRDATGAWLPATGPLVNSLTVAELKKYDVGRLDPKSRYGQQWTEQKPHDGERIPTLAELFDLVHDKGKDKVRFNLEFKLKPDAPNETPDPKRFAELVVHAVREAKVTSRVTLQSFDWRPLRAVKQIAPDIATACLSIESPNMDNIQRGRTGPSPWTAGLDLATYDGSLAKLVNAAGCSTWSPFWRNVTPALLAEAKHLGLKVIPWTINDPAEMERQIGMGVDGIITDYPDRLRKVMQAKGMKLP
jgi:glycerophosphoryl diester phosphodiesterase